MKTALESAKSILFDALERVLVESRADGYRAGYAAAIERAAKLVDEKGCGSSFCLHPGAVRALAKEKP